GRSGHRPRRRSPVRTGVPVREMRGIVPEAEGGWIRFFETDEDRAVLDDDRANGSRMAFGLRDDAVGVSREQRRMPGAQLSGCGSPFSDKGEGAFRRSA